MVFVCVSVCSIGSYPTEEYPSKSAVSNIILSIYLCLFITHIMAARGEV